MILFSIADKKTPKERMIQVVKWYMSAYHAGRKSSVAKKPYNPILGEVFQCHWDIPGFTETADNTPVVNGPLPWCTRGQLAFIAEQVSHHPPSERISLFIFVSFYSELLLILFLIRFSIRFLCRMRSKENLFRSVRLYKIKIFGSFRRSA